MNIHETHATLFWSPSAQLVLQERGEKVVYDTPHAASHSLVIFPCIFITQRKQDIIRFCKGSSHDLLEETIVEQIATNIFDTLCSLFKQYTSQHIYTFCVLLLVP